MGLHGWGWRRAAAPGAKHAPETPIQHLLGREEHRPPSPPPAPLLPALLQPLTPSLPFRVPPSGSSLFRLEQLGQSFSHPSAAHGESLTKKKKPSRTRTHHQGRAVGGELNLSVMLAAKVHNQPKNKNTHPFTQVGPTLRMLQPSAAPQTSVTDLSRARTDL